ncbi:hypothetical protein ARMGADRAFT_410676 [Armillaria gallica]|uniref:Uncharacterized protein n=1 Tax=Armillaria gallica TaxID=47427 RepID=A0A2H3E452_ARMGA|nr:hypothetical protein ARMGADRAFT_410676 [Armillaria gallica]
MFSLLLLPSSIAPITTGIRNGVNTITDEYPDRLRWPGSCFDASIAICQLTSFLTGKHQLRHKKAPAVPESNKVQLQRLPLAFLDFYRILSIPVTVGVEYYSLNVAEAFLACICIVPPLGNTSAMRIVSDHSLNRDISPDRYSCRWDIWSYIPRWPRWEPSYESVSVGNTQANFCYVRYCLCLNLVITGISPDKVRISVIFIKSACICCSSATYNARQPRRAFWCFGYTLETGFVASISVCIERIKGFPSRSFKVSLSHKGFACHHSVQD